MPSDAKPKKNRLIDLAALAALGWMAYGSVGELKLPFNIFPQKVSPAVESGWNKRPAAPQEPLKAESVALASTLSSNKPAAREHASMLLGIVDVLDRDSRAENKSVRTIAQLQALLERTEAVYLQGRGLGGQVPQEFIRGYAEYLKRNIGVTGDYQPQRAIEVLRALAWAEMGL